MVLIPSVVDVTSVVVTLKILVVVVGRFVVEAQGIVALNPFVFSLARSGAAKEEERWRRQKASFITVAVLKVLLFWGSC